MYYRDDQSTHSEKPKAKETIKAEKPKRKANEKPTEKRSEVDDMLDNAVKVATAVMRRSI
jgi:hypothetical protein